MDYSAARPGRGTWMLQGPTIVKVGTSCPTLVSWDLCATTQLSGRNPAEPGALGYEPLKAAKWGR